MSGNQVKSDKKLVHKQLTVTHVIDMFKGLNLPVNDDSQQIEAKGKELRDFYLRLKNSSDPQERHRADLWFRNLMELQKNRPVLLDIVREHFIQLADTALDKAINSGIKELTPKLFEQLKHLAETQCKCDPLLTQQFVEDYMHKNNLEIGQACVKPENENLEKLENLYNQAKKLMEDAQWERAKEVFKDLEQLQTGYKDVQDQIHRIDKHIEECDERYWKAVRLREEHKWEEAEKNFRELNELHPWYRDVAENIEYLHELFQRSEKLYQQATEYVEKHQWLKARETFFELDLLRPDYRDVEKWCHILRNNDDVRDLQVAQDRLVYERLEAAVPEQVNINQSFELAVAVRQLTSPVLEEEDLPHVRSGDLQTFWPESQNYIILRVQISAPDCEIHEQDHYSFRLYRGQDSPIFYFQLTPKKVGKISIIINVYQEEEILGSARVHTLAQEQVVGSVQLEITSHPLKIYNALEIPDTYDPIRIQKFLANRVDLEELCFLLQHRLKPIYAYHQLTGSIPVEKSRALVQQANRFGELGDLIYHLVLYWLEEIHGRPSILYEEEIYQELLVFQRELVGQGELKKAEHALALFNEILNTSENTKEEKT